MSNERILVVEDEEDILELVRYNLAREGYKVTCVSSGEEGLRQVKENSPDLLILDLMLPGMNGLDVCREIKADPAIRSMPVLMLTAKSEESDIVAGLETGADDYVTKPFSPKVLVSRVRAVLRRKNGVTEAPAGEVITFGDLVIHAGKHEVTVEGQKVPLTYTEFFVLNTLASRPGWVFTRYQIVDAVRGGDYPVTDRSVDVQIVGLRKKLGSCGKHIETVRGVGYRFVG